ncbi:MAG TPA: ABC transporter substrate-binding protein [Pseudolabrys sp.]|jgi:ABC-type nitrate/sulfonate/bicarbonate transport system substrate-binding protein|nr:ABC transporter substrate-binding protein [Pseudolabrys sp.]
MMNVTWGSRTTGLLILAAVLLGADAGQQAADAAACNTMRKINIGVSVSPPNVVHTTPYVAKELGYFAKHCVDATIIQFEGGRSPASKAAAANGTALVSVSPVAIGRGVKVRQIWGLAPRLPQSYTVSADVKSAKDLKGKRLSASGGGVGSFNWIMGRAMLESVGLKVEDAKFIAGSTAGRLPGLLTGQLDGVSLHPESVYLGMKKNKGIHVLVHLADLMPKYSFNSYGASIDWIKRDHDLMADAVAAMIEANREIYRDEAKVVPIMMKATGRPKDAVEFAWKDLTEHCVWSVNQGFDPERTKWTIDYDVQNGDIDAKNKPTAEQVFDKELADEAVKRAGGPVKIGKCAE